jgi:hypothetical protein
MPKTCYSRLLISAGRVAASILSRIIVIVTNRRSDGMFFVFVMRWGKFHSALRQSPAEVSTYI